MFAELLAPAHLIFLGLICLFLFGGKTLAKLGKGFQDGVRNFKNSSKKN